MAIEKTRSLIIGKSLRLISRALKLMTLKTIKYGLKKICKYDIKMAKNVLKKWPKKIQKLVLN